MQSLKDIKASAKEIWRILGTMIQYKPDNVHINAVMAPGNQGSEGICLTDADLMNQALYN